MGKEKHLQKTTARRTRIYTKTGDKGTTSLFNGKRVKKSNDLIELVGQMDQLNSYIGLIISTPLNIKSKVFIKNFSQLEYIQSILFEIGAEIANPAKHNKLNLNKQTAILEVFIDEMDEELIPLTHFILPVGSNLASNIHLTRTQTRAAERVFSRLMKSYYNESVFRFLNRLSDYLFTLARYTNMLQGKKDVIWKKDLNT